MWGLIALGINWGLPFNSPQQYSLTISWLYPTHQPLIFPLPSTPWEVDVPRATQPRNFWNFYNIWKRHGSPAHHMHALHQPGPPSREQWELIVMLRVGITVSTRMYQTTKWISTSWLHIYLYRWSSSPRRNCIRGRARRSRTQRSRSSCNFGQPMKITTSSPLTTWSNAAAWLIMQRTKLAWMTVCFYMYMLEIKFFLLTTIRESSVLIHIMMHST